MGLVQFRLPRFFVSIWLRYDAGFDPFSRLRGIIKDFESILE
jgi:hypothetical protein